MQSTLLGLAIAMIAALITALAAPFFIDWNHYRTAFEAEASHMVGEPVRIGGSIDVRLLPTPSLLVRKVEIGPAGAPVFSAGVAGFDLALGSLVRGQLRAVSARLDGPSFDVALDADGKVRSAMGLARLNIEQVSIDQLDVQNAHVTLADAASGTRVELDKLSFSGEVRGLGGPIKGQGTFTTADRSFAYRIAASRGDENATKIRLGLDAADRPLTVEADLSLSFENDAPRYDGNVTLARLAGMALAGGKTVTSDPWRISGRIKGDDKRALIEQIDMRYGPEERAVKLTGTADMAFGAKPRLDAVLSARQLDLDRAVAATDAANRLPAALLRGLGDALGAVWMPPVALNIGIGIEAVTLGGATLQAVRGDFKAGSGSWSVDSFEFRAPGGTQVKLSGRIDGKAGLLQFTGPIAVESFNPQALMTWVNGASDSDRPIIAPLTVRGDLTVGPQQVALERIVADYNRKAFDGRVAFVYAAGGRPARFDATLNAADFDLDGMRAILAPMLAGGQFNWPGELALALNFDRATLAGHEAKSVLANLRWDAAGLRIERLAMGDFGGAAIAASGQIDMLAAPPRGAVSVWVDAQKLDSVAALVANVSPLAADALRRSASLLAPAKLEASLKVEPPKALAAGVKNVGKLSVAGSLGGIRVNLSGDASGDLAAWSDAFIRLDGRLGSTDASLLSVLGLDRMGTPSRPAELTLSVNGPVSGDLRLDAHLRGGGLDASALGGLRLDNGDLKGGMDIVLNASDLRATRGDVAPLPVTAKSHAAIAGGIVSFTGMTGTVAGTPVRAQLTFSPQPSRVEGKVATDSLNVPLAFAAAIGAQAADAANPGAWSAQPFASGLLAGADGSIEFDAAQAAIVPGVVARNVHGVVRFKSAEMMFDNMTGNLGEGSLAGWARFRALGNGLSASGRLAINNADAAAVVPGNGRSPLAGRLSSQLEMESEGSSPAALIGALRGKGSVTLEGVQVAGFDAGAFDVTSRAVERGIAITPDRIGDIVNRVMDSGILNVAWASLPVEIASGRVRLGKLVGPPRDDDLSLSGSIDLVERTLDTRVTIFGKAEPGAARPEISVAFKGPIGAPRRTVDVTGLIGWLTLQSVDRASKRLEAAEQRAKSADNSNSAAHEEPPRSTSSIAPSVAAEQAAPPLGPAVSVPPRRPQPALYGTASSPTVPLPPSR